MAHDALLVERIRERLAGVPHVREQRMFGGVAFLIGGHMALAASGQGGLLVRVPAEQTEQLRAEPDVEPFVMRNRTMDGWVRVSARGVEDPDGLERWVTLGLRTIAGLAPKV